MRGRRSAAAGDGAVGLAASRLTLTPRGASAPVLLLPNTSSHPSEGPSLSLSSGRSVLPWMLSFSGAFLPQSARSFLNDSDDVSQSQVFLGTVGGYGNNRFQAKRKDSEYLVPK